MPSSGGRHPFETYLAINDVLGVEPGLYRYLPFEHKLLLLLAVKGLPAKLTEIATAAGCSEYGIEDQTPETFSYRMQWE